MKATQLFLAISVLIFVLSVVEIIYCIHKKNNFINLPDSLLSYGALALAHCVNIASVYPLYFSYDWIYQNFAIFHFETTWWTAIICFVGCDLAFYWFHRLAHRINVFWAAHISHHTSEEYNLMIAFRGSITQRAISFLYYWPLCVLGFDANTVITLIGVNLALNGLTHTRLVKRFPRWIEAWLVTPYHHQVHHAVNPVYWDKNFAGTFIFWDRLFGTYQEQTEPVYYGVSERPDSWDPLHMNFYIYRNIWKDFRKTKHWTDKLKVLFYVPSFRPADLPPKEQIDFKSRIKYASPFFVNAKPYVIFQMVMVYFLLVPILNPQSFLNGIQKTLLSSLIFFHVYIIALFLEAKSIAKLLECVRYGLLFLFFFTLPASNQAKGLQIVVSVTTIASLLYLAFKIDQNKVIPAQETLPNPDPVLNH